jgi:hypothetical protein
MNYNPLYGTDKIFITVMCYFIDLFPGISHTKPQVNACKENNSGGQNFIL